ncbi:hypothetical protein B0O99DRAFT_652971 [Bisporella sp. PMI_857]|nr:hypothetical protein B0O99DRAFT_652971 [Bisporella sp. PMI_857]
MDEFVLDAFNPTKPNSFIAITSHQLYSSQDNFSSEVSKEKGRCTYPDNGKYRIMGYVWKYGKNRHLLTFYKAAMVCGFCPGSGSAAEKSFSRADVFKRHLTSVHAVDPTPPSSSKKISAAGNVNSAKKLSETFNSAQEFYEHLGDRVLHLVQQEEASQAINAARLAEFENDQSAHGVLRNDTLPTTANSRSKDENEDDQPVADDEDSILSRKERRNNRQKYLHLTHTKGSLPSKTKAQGSVVKTYVADLEAQTTRRAEAFHNSVQDKGPGSQYSYG